jgi:hypothetical protein
MLKSEIEDLRGVVEVKDRQIGQWQKRNGLAEEALQSQID